MATKLMERPSTSLIIQIKTTKGYHLTPVRMAIINNHQITSAGKWRKGNPHTLLVGL